MSTDIAIRQAQLDARVAARADELFEAQTQDLAKRTDRLLSNVMLLQWPLAIAFALLVAPRRWEGAYSQVNLHVWTALILGGIITLFPVYMARTFCGRAITRHVIAAGQMLMSALLIHLTGGRIETHFHVFGSLAFLAFYRDWRPLATATIVVAADHLLRGYLWPASVYGVLSSTPWRSFEHAAWVLFEDAVLVKAIAQSLAEMRALAARQARVEDVNQNLEARVMVRTAELKESEEVHRHMVQTLPIGLIRADDLDRCLFVNDRFAAMIGLRKDQLLDKSWVDAVHAEDRSKADKLRKAGAGMEEVARLRLVGATGVPRWVEARARCLSLDDGQPAGLVIAFDEAKTLTSVA